MDKGKGFLKLFNAGSIVPENKPKKAANETVNYWIYRYDDIVYKIQKKPIEQHNLNIAVHYLSKLRNHAGLLSPKMCFEVFALQNEKGEYKLDPFEFSNKYTERYVFKTDFLSPKQMLDNLIVSGKMTDKILESVCEALYEFHQRAPVYADRYAGTYEHLLKVIDDLIFQSKKHLHKTISPAAISLTEAPVHRFLLSSKRTLFNRQKSEKIRETHRCFVPSKIHIDKNDVSFIPMIIDNLNETFYDVCADVADFSLSMDLMGQKEWGQKFVDHYVKISKDNELLQVLPFYKVLKGYQRGLYESMKLLGDPTNPDPLKKASKLYDKAAEMATDLSQFVNNMKVEEAPED